MDAAERQDRHDRAEALVPALAERGVVAVATSFVDNSGISRVKSVPLARLPHLAAYGVGFSPAFNYFRFDDWVVAPASGEGPVGDQRIVPDLDRLVLLSSQPGFAWAPGQRYEQDGSAHAQCSRTLLAAQVEQLRAEGIEVRAAIEIEWVVSSSDGDDFVAGAGGPGYGLARLGEVSDYARDLLVALAEQGVVVEQFHPEYAAGQLELSVVSESPVDAADTSVLVRHTVRTVGLRYGLRTSFSPKVDVSGVGNGGHVHLSLWRDGQNLMTGGAGPGELGEQGAAFAAGVLEHLPALLAVGAPSVASYLRLVPSHWAGAYRCWGVENREAALRMVTASPGAPGSANLEVKCFDLHANPYLALAAVIAAGRAAMASGTALPDPVDVDPAALHDGERAARGIDRLPATLREATDAFAADQVLIAALGAELVAAVVAVRQSEIEVLADADADAVAAAVRWTH